LPYQKTLALLIFRMITLGTIVFCANFCLVSPSCLFSGSFHLYIALFAYSHKHTTHARKISLLYHKMRKFPTFPLNEILCITKLWHKN
jgi:hypothetical protein